MKFGDAKSKLADWLGAANTKRLSDAVRGDVLNLARRDLCKRDLRFNEAEVTITTVAMQPDYPLPAGWLRPYQMWYINPSTTGRVDVAYALREDFDQRFPDPGQGALPSLYTVWGAALRFGKTPDQVVGIHHTYYRALPDLSDPDDEDDLMREAWEVVHFKALANATAYMVEDARIAVWQSTAADLEWKLVNDHARSRSVGRRPIGQEPG